MSDLITHTFSTSLYHKDLEPSEKLEEFCKNYSLKNISEHNTSFFEPLQKELADLLMPVIKNFFQEVGSKYGYVGMELKHTWIQHYETAHSHRIHIHSVFPDDWSFVYYVDCGEDSAETVFYNYGYPYIDHGVYKVKPKRGRCVLFPGAMSHEAQPNREDKRMVISGNLSFTR